MITRAGQELIFLLGEGRKKTKQKMVFPLSSHFFFEIVRALPINLKTKNVQFPTTEKYSISGNPKPKTILVSSSWEKILGFCFSDLFFYEDPNL